MTAIIDFFTGTGKHCSLLQFVEFMIMRESNFYEYDLSLLAVSRDTNSVKLMKRLMFSICIAYD